MSAWDNLPDGVGNGDPRAPWNEADEDEDEEEGAERDDLQEWGWRVPDRDPCEWGHADACPWD